MRFTSISQKLFSGKTYLFQVYDLCQEVTVVEDFHFYDRAIIFILL